MAAHPIDIEQHLALARRSKRLGQENQRLVSALKRLADMGDNLSPLAVQAEYTAALDRLRAKN